MGIFKRGDSPYWWYRIQLEGRVATGTTGTTDKKLAERVYLEKRRQAVEVQNFPSQAGKYMTLSKMCDLYLQNHAKVNKRSWKGDEAKGKKLVEFFGDVPLGQISPQKIEQYKASRKADVKDATINRELACLKTIFTKAVLWGYAASNPVKQVKLFREELTPVKLLTPEEKRKLLDHSPDFLRPIITTALLTGMRKGEIRNLKWEDLDLTNQNIHVRRTKSGKMRILPMHPELHALLTALFEKRRGKYVFCDENGARYEEGGAIRTSFEAAVEAAKLGDFTFHDLRHNFASELVQKGADLRTVQEYLGHSTLMMVQRYSHVSEGIRRSTIQLLGPVSKFSDRKEGGPSIPHAVRGELDRGGRLK